jgi:HEAT repeat protein
MATYYCPRCWHEVKEDERACPHCGADIVSIQSGRDYVAKLVAALSHTEPTTPRRAAWLLGKLRAREAVDALLDILRGKADPYIKESAVDALGQIGDPRAAPALAELAQGRPVLLRGPAEEALKRLARQ